MGHDLRLTYSGLHYSLTFVPKQGIVFTWSVIKEIIGDTRITIEDLVFLRWCAIKTNGNIT